MQPDAMEEQGYTLDKPLLLSVCSGLGKFVQKPGSEARLYVKADDCLGGHAWAGAQLCGAGGGAWRQRGPDPLWVFKGGCRCPARPQRA